VHEGGWTLMRLATGALWKGHGQMMSAGCACRSSSARQEAGLPTCAAARCRFFDCARAASRVAAAAARPSCVCSIISFDIMEQPPHLQCSSGATGVGRAHERQRSRAFPMRAYCLPEHSAAVQQIAVTLHRSVGRDQFCLRASKNWLNGARGGRLLGSRPAALRPPAGCRPP
jgi:hypothetical protein